MDHINDGLRLLFKWMPQDSFLLNTRRSDPRSSITFFRKVQDVFQNFDHVLFMLYSTSIWFFLTVSVLFELTIIIYPGTLISFSPFYPVRRDNLSEDCLRKPC